MKCYYVIIAFIVWKAKSQQNSSGIISRTIKLTSLSASSENPFKVSNFCKVNDEECCNNTLQDFRANWMNGKVFLTRLLDTLQSANCSAFSQECEFRTFSYNRFTELVYDRFCDPRKFESKCPEQNDTFQKTKIAKNFMNPCRQVLMYRESFNYLEIVTPYTPFCGLVWCGFDIETYKSLNASVWTCMEKKCQANVKILMATCGILGFIAIVLNTTVLWVLLTLRRSRLNSQHLYRFSLGVADLLMGLVVFPSYVSTLYFKFIKQRNVVFGKIENSTNSTIVAEFDEALPYSYLAVLGLITTVSFAVSIYSLALAGFDRLHAVLKPMYYNQSKAVNRAKYMLVFVWLFSILLGTLPLYTPSLYPYSLISGLVVATTENDALYEYVVALGIPLVSVWISVAIIFRTIQKQNKSSRFLSNRSKAKEQRTRKVYKTLVLMLVAFTSSLLPTLVGMFAQADQKVHEKQPNLFDPDLSAHLSSYEVFSAMVLSCNSLWNFFIYSARDDEFRKLAMDKYGKLLSLLWPCRESARKSFDRRLSPAFSTQASNLSKSSKSSHIQKSNESLSAIGGIKPCNKRVNYLDMHV